MPILAGLKTTGRIGGTTVGALVVRTREEQDLAPAASMGALRLRQDLFEESSAGVLATFGDPLGRSGSWELGGDFRYQTSRFRGDKNFLVGVWGLATGRDDLAGARERTAFGFKVDYPNDLFDCFVLYRRVGDGFDPSLGFVARPGVNSYESGCTYAPRPKDSFVRQLTFQLYPILTTDLGGRWESYEVLTSPLGLLFESGDAHRDWRRADGRAPGQSVRGRRGGRRFPPARTTFGARRSRSRRRRNGGCRGTRPTRSAASTTARCSSGRPTSRSPLRLSLRSSLTRSTTAAGSLRATSTSLSWG